MKKIIALFIALVMSLSLIGTVSVSAEGLSGAGTAADPYKISTAADLDAFMAMSESFTDGMYFVLTNDIAYTDYKAGGEAPSKTWSGPEYFAGTFDGQGYTISGLYFSDTSKKEAGVGFIASTSKTATDPIVIKNVNIADSYFEVKQHVGGILGKAHGNGICDVTVSGCSSSATIKATGTSYAGGIVGFSSNVKVTVTIENCLFTGNIDAGACTGGIIGQMGTSTEANVEKPSYVKNCLNLGTVAGSRIVGGIVGRDYYGCNVIDCVNAGTVTANTSDTKYSMQFGSVVSWEKSLNKDSYYLASNPAKQISQPEGVSCADSKHKAVDSFTAANCPTLSADYWVFTNDGVMLKTFAAAAEGGDETTIAPEETTLAPEETTEAVTEPGQAPSGGDSAWIFVIIAAVAVASTALVAKKKEN